MMRIKTSKMKEMLSNVKDILSKQAVIEILNGLELKVEDETFIITGSDSSIFVKTKTKEFEGELDRCIVDGKKLINLVNKTTKEYITIKFDNDSFVEVAGNGKYKIEIYQEDDYMFPELPEFDEEIQEYTIDIVALGIAIDSLKYALSGYSVYEYTNGIKVVKDGALATDMVRFMNVKDEIIKEADDDINILIPKNILGFLTNFKEDINLIVSGSNLLFKNDTYEVFALEHDGKDSFPDLPGIISNLDYTEIIKVNTDEFKEILDRLNIFTESLTGNLVSIEIEEDGNLIVYDTKNKKAMENLGYQKVKLSGNNTIVNLDGETFTTFMKGYTNQEITISFSNDIPIRIQQEDVDGIFAPVVMNED